MPGRGTRKVSMRFADEKAPLAAEEGARKPRIGQVAMRALHNFMFYDKETRKPISPAPEALKGKFWSQCAVEGKVASLSGAAKNLVQAGYWDVQWTDSHFVTMCLQGIVGLHFEEDLHYRNGHPALFLYTRSYAYVLLAPSEYYEPTWKRVLSEWETYTGEDLTFDWLDLSKPRPSWWEPDGEDYEDWNYIQRMVNPSRVSRERSISRVESSPSRNSTPDSSEGSASADDTTHFTSLRSDSARVGVTTRSASKRLVTENRVCTNAEGHRGKGAARKTGRGQETREEQQVVSDNPKKTKGRLRLVVGGKKDGGKKSTGGDMVSGIEGEEHEGRTPMLVGISGSDSRRSTDYEATCPSKDPSSADSPPRPPASDTEAGPSAKRARTEPSSSRASVQTSPPPPDSSPSRTARRLLLAKAAENRALVAQQGSVSTAPSTGNPGSTPRVTTPLPVGIPPSASSKDPVPGSSSPPTFAAPFTQIPLTERSRPKPILGPSDTHSVVDDGDDMSVSEDDDVGGQAPLPPLQPTAANAPVSSTTAAATQTNIAGVSGWSAATLKISGRAGPMAEGPSNAVVAATEVLGSPVGPGDSILPQPESCGASELSSRLIPSNVDELDLTPDDM